MAACNSLKAEQMCRPRIHKRIHAKNTLRLNAGVSWCFLTDMVGENVIGVQVWVSRNKIASRKTYLQTIHCCRGCATSVLCVCVCLYHNSCEQTHSPATVGVRHHVSISNGEEGDGDEPHCTQKITGHILSIMVPEREKKETEVQLGNI